MVRSIRWRLLIWWVLLWRLARLDLRLIPTHPDLAGGLGGLGVAHTDLAPFSFGVSAMLVASYAEDILFSGATLESLVLPLTGIVLGMTALVLAPLVFFAPRLLSAKQRGLLDYGELAATYTEEFDAKWVRGGGTKSDFLGTADLQSLADLGNSFETIRSTRIVPITRQAVMALGVATLLPIAPLLLTVIPAEELAKQLLKLLL